MFEAHKRLADLPSRFTSVILDHEDPAVDAALAEVEADTGLFSDLSGTALAKARWLKRIELLAEEVLGLVEELDGTATAYAERLADPSRFRADRRLRLELFLQNASPAI